MFHFIFKGIAIWTIWQLQQLTCIICGSLSLWNATREVTRHLRALSLSRSRRTRSLLFAEIRIRSEQRRAGQRRAAQQKPQTLLRDPHFGQDEASVATNDSQWLLLGASQTWSIDGRWTAPRAASASRFASQFAARSQNPRQSQPNRANSRGTRVCEGSEVKQTWTRVCVPVPVCCPRTSSPSAHLKSDNDKGPLVRF